MANFQGFIHGLLYAVKVYFNVMFLLLKLPTRLGDLHDNLIITVFFTFKQLKTTCRTSQTVNYAHTG